MNIPFSMQFCQSGKSLLHIDNPFRSMDFESNHTQLCRRTPLSQQSCTHTHDTCRRLPFQTRCREESRLCIQHCFKCIGDRVHLTHIERATQNVAQFFLVLIMHTGLLRVRVSSFSLSKYSSSGRCIWRCLYSDRLSHSTSILSCNCLCCTCSPLGASSANPLTRHALVC